MLMRTVPPRQGSQLITEAWALFRVRPAVWIALGAIDLVVSVILSSIPFAADLTSVFTVMWAGGMSFAAEQCRTTGIVRVSDAFDGIRAKFQPLLAISLFALVVALVCDFAGGHAPGSLRLAGPIYPGAGASAGEWLAGAIYVVAAVLGTMALWLAPPLIVVNDVAPLEALKASFSAACYNAWPSLVYGLIVVGFALAALLTLGIGLIVLAPLVYLSTYTACRDVFPQSGLGGL
jgi:hypothetical protein